MRILLALLAVLVVLVAGCSSKSPEADLSVPLDAAVESGAPDTKVTKPDTLDPIKAFCDKVGQAGCCDPASKVVWCEAAAIKELACPTTCGWEPTQGVYDCQQTGEDPSGAHPRTCPGKPCTPSCAAGKCGLDNGCGVPCSCGTGFTCQSGSCVPDTTGCTDGSKRCNGNDIEVCTSKKWGKQSTCPNGCAAGVCIGGDCSGCPIAAAGLKVTFPWVTLGPPTVVKTSGACYVGTNPKPCGVKSASYLKVLKYTGGSAAIQDLGAGILWGIDFALGQAVASAAELSGLASSTGLPVAELQKSMADETLVMSDPPKLVGYTLPTGVSLSAFLPSSPSSPGNVRFQATTANKAGLTTVLGDLGAGITIDLTVKLFLGPGQYIYRCKLTKSGLQITAITP